VRACSTNSRRAASESAAGVDTLFRRIATAWLKGLKAVVMISTSLPISRTMAFSPAMWLRNRGSLNGVGRSAAQSDGRVTRREVSGA